MLCRFVSHTSSYFFFFKQKTAYEMRISDWSSDVCSSDLQRLGIVEQHFRRNPAEAQESAFHPREPVRLALPKRRADMQPPRVTQRRHEQVHPHSRIRDPHPGDAKVDLHLMARRRLEPHRRAIGRAHV